MSECIYCLKAHEGECKREDLENALEEYERRKFFNQMKDGWDSDDRAFNQKMERYIRQIEKKLEVMTNA